MAETPLVSIVVACLNAGQYLAETLDSVRTQTMPYWECVVVDDGSTDNTAEISDGFAATDRRVRVVRQANAGVSSARNAGIAAASPDVPYLAFLDGDDVWQPDALQTLFDALEHDPAAVGVYGTAEYIDRDGHPVRPGAHPAVQADRRVLGRYDFVPVAVEEPSTFSSLLVSGTIWPSGVVLHRREVVERVGCFDPEMARAQDWELYLRMSRLGHFVAVPHQVAWYRRHGENATAADQGVTVAAHLLTVRWKAWTSSANSRRQHREAGRVWRRLAGRWVVWTVQAGLSAARHRDRPGTTQALAAALYFARRSRHPVEPDTRMATVTARYVTARAAGAGSPLP